MPRYRYSNVDRFNGDVPVRYLESNGRKVSIYIFKHFFGKPHIRRTDVRERYRVRAAENIIFRDIHVRAEFHVVSADRMFIAVVIYRIVMTRYRYRNVDRLYRDIPVSYVKGYRIKVIVRIFKLTCGKPHIPGTDVRERYRVRAAESKVFRSI